MTKCAVCGDPVDERSAPSAQYHGATYYFCCEECKQQFLSDPKRYAKTAPAVT